MLGEAADGGEGARLVQELDPDVVLMDLRMPHVDGIEATRRIVAAGSGTGVLVLTTFEGEELTFRALRAGASRLPAQGRRGARLVAAVEAAAAGERRWRRRWWPGWWRPTSSGAGRSRRRRPARRPERAGAATCSH